jgi:hypothetical protein
MIDARGMLSQGIHPKEVSKAVVHAINNLKPLELSILCLTLIVFSLISDG